MDICSDPTEDLLRNIMLQAHIIAIVVIWEKKYQKWNDTKCSYSNNYVKQHMKSVTFWNLKSNCYSYKQIISVLLNNLSEIDKEYRCLFTSCVLIIDRSDSARANINITQGYSLKQQICWKDVNASLNIVRNILLS